MKIFSRNIFEHRRDWIVERVKFLASVFQIQVCSYAIMSNHYHLVLKVNDTKDWSIHQVLIHWQSLCKLPFHCQKSIDKGALMLRYKLTFTGQKYKY